MMQIVLITLLFTALVCAEQRIGAKEGGDSVRRDFAGLQELVNQYANEYYPNGRNGDNYEPIGKLFARQPRNRFSRMGMSPSLTDHNFVLY